MKNYKDTLNFLYSQLPMFQNKGSKAYNNKLDKSQALDAYFEYPHRHYKTIHVGGTNGKGSVSHLLASVLQSAGYKVGLYTSPHLKDFRERIKINGTPCSKDFVVDFVEKHTAIIKQLQPSFFEMTVAMAFEYFKQEQVDVAVVEVGLGGRLDSTNIITPILSVITNISKDHTAMLGNTLQEIALEKAGIIKANVPVVIGEYQEDIADVFIGKAKEKEAPLVFGDKKSHLTNIRKTVTQLCFDWEQIKDINCPLIAAYQYKNINTALTSLKEQKILAISSQSIREGCEKVITQTHFRGRWEVLGTNPLTVCDTGHNEAGIKWAMMELSLLKFKQLHIILGVSNDKDLDTILPLFPKSAQYYFTQAQVQRAMSARDLQEKAKAFGLYGNFYENVDIALTIAKSQAKEEDVIYVGGSIFIVAEAIS